MTKTFGEAFGQLIREKRGQENLTQKELAIRAFNDESKVRRINDLENGAIKRPHVKTIDPLVVYFNITKEEIENCRKGGLFTEEEQSSIGLNRQLIENLALRFEHGNPDAPDSELFSYLKDKADEFKRLKMRLENLEAVSSSLHNQIASAKAALEAGQFSEADTILAAAEEFQQEARTLREIRAQSQIRFARGDAALFSGEGNIAAEHYTKAADYFSAFNKQESASVLTEGAGQIYEYERRTLNPNFQRAIEMATSALKLLSRESNRKLWVLTKYRLGLLQQVQARATRSRILLENAIKTSEEALTYADNTIDDFDYASIVVLRGNCYLARGQQIEDSGWEKYIDTAITVFEMAIQDARISDPEQRCYLFNSIFAAYSEKSIRAKEGGDNNQLSTKAMKALLRAIELSAQTGQLDVWGNCQFNLGSELAARARSKQAEDMEFASFLRIQAIAAFNASLEAYPQTLLTPQIARTQLALGNALLDQARSCAKTLREVYLIRSIGAFQVGSAVYAEDSVEWSYAQFSIGLAFFLHAEVSGREMAIDDLTRALEFFDVALPGYKSPELEHDLKKLRAAQKEAKTRLHALQAAKREED